MWPEHQNVYLLARGIHWTNFQQTGNQHLDLDLWPCDMKIHMDHLLPMGIHYTKFGSIQHSSKGVKRYWVDFTWSTDRQTDRQVQFHSAWEEGGINKWIIKWFTLQLNLLDHVPNRMFVYQWISKMDILIFD